MNQPLNIVESAAGGDSPMVFVIDDDPSIRESLGSLLRSARFCVKVFSSAHEFLREQLPKVPTCMVLDLNMPEVTGLELQRELTLRRYDLPIIFLTGHADIPTTVRAIKEGAVEFLTKPFHDLDLMAAIQRALDCSQSALRRQNEISELSARYKSLTPREREVMQLVSQGLLNKQAAAQLGTSEITVKIQRGQVMRKMNATSLPDLVRMSDRLNAGTRQ